MKTWKKKADFEHLDYIEVISKEKQYPDLQSHASRDQGLPQRRETLAEVKARLIEELKQRTEAKVNHWKRLGDWCKQRPGRHIKVDWRTNK